MDKSLDEILADRQRSSGRGRRTTSSRRNDRSNYPRDGVRKQSTRDDGNGSMDREWVHDKYDDNAPRSRGPRPSENTSNSAKLRVDNVHYELTEKDLEGLFTRIGPISRLVLNYDRAGRSNGVCYVTYESVADAKQAIREFDGANANGQPIRLVSIPDRDKRSRNPFDSISEPAKSLESRISAPGARGDSVRHSDVSGPVPSNIDRYVPGEGRSRSPNPRRRDGRRPGERRGRGNGGGRGREPGTRNERPKKTAEQLDAEMEDYWGGAGQPAGETASAPASAPAANGVAEAAGDVDMIE